MTGNPVYNAEGFVAVRQMRQSQKLIEVHGNQYLFVVRASGISMAWIRPDDLEAVLAYTYSCNCGGAPRVRFTLASDDAVRRWTNGGGR